MKLRYAIIPLVVLALVAAAIVVVPIVFLVGFTEPTNSRDNANADMKPEMIRCTLAWGRLAPFPKSADDFTIYTEGGSFTRTFRGSFSDTPENIKTWLQSSQGVTEGEKDKENKIILKTGEGASYGEVLVSPDGSHVTFRVSWS